jgi:cyclic pyranopterin phosphate synthase
MFSHLDAQNRPAMVNVGDKVPTHRTAHAVAVVALPPELAALLRDGDIKTKKGPIFQTAVLASRICNSPCPNWVPLRNALQLGAAS